MHKDIERIIISEEAIAAKITHAAAWINEHFANKNLVMIGLLKGCVPFFGRLMTQITLDFVIDFMYVRSYHGTLKSTGKAQIVTDIVASIIHKDVLIVEDIIDNAYTLRDVIDHLRQKKPNSIAVITLLDKKAGRKVSLNPDFSCFEIGNEFLVGFGLDYQEKLRNLPYVGVFKIKQN